MQVKSERFTYRGWKILKTTDNSTEVWEILDTGNIYGHFDDLKSDIDNWERSQN